MAAAWRELGLVPFLYHIRPCLEIGSRVWAVEHTTQGTLGGGRRAADRPIAPTPSEAPLPPGAAPRCATACSRRSLVTGSRCSR